MWEIFFQNEEVSLKSKHDSLFAMETNTIGTKMGLILSHSCFELWLSFDWNEFLLSVQASIEDK